VLEHYRSQPSPAPMRSSLLRQPLTRLDDATNATLPVLRSCAQAANQVRTRARAAPYGTSYLCAPLGSVRPSVRLYAAKPVQSHGPPSFDASNKHTDARAFTHNGRCGCRPRKGVRTGYLRASPLELLLPIQLLVRYPTRHNTFDTDTRTDTRTNNGGRFRGPFRSEFGIPYRLPALPLG
jgi:hypothetical protein